MEREMVQVSVFENGEILIEPAESNLATQKILIYRSSKDGRGEGYYCLKGRENFYIRKLITDKIKEQDDIIKQAMVAKEKYAAWLNKQC